MNMNHIMLQRELNRWRNLCCAYMLATCVLLIIIVAMGTVR